MAQAVLVLVALFAGLVGFYEATKVERRFNEGPWGLSAPICGLLAFGAGMIGSLIATSIVLSVVVGFVGYNEAAIYERVFRRPLLVRPTWQCGTVCGVAAFLFGLAASTAISGGLCLLAGLVGALVLVLAERDALAGENAALVTLNDALVGEKKSLLAEKAKTKQASSAEPKSESYSNAVAAALRAERQPPRQQHMHLVPPSSESGSDFLPGRLQPPAADGYDLLPGRR
jgi:hypothetical protein